MKTRKSSVGKQILALLLAILTVLSLCTPALAAGESEVATALKDSGFLELKVYPYIGGLEPENRSENARTVSFSSSIYMDRNTGEVDRAHSVMGFDVVGTWVSSTGSKHTVNVWADTKKTQTFSYATYKASGQNTATALMKTDTTLDSQTIYFFAECPDTGDSLVISTTVRRYATATTSIRYTRVGMQVRGVSVSEDENIAFGKYDYKTKDGSYNYKTLNGDGESLYNAHVDSPEVPDELTGRSFQECYFYISMEDVESAKDGTKVLSGVSNMAQLYTDMRKWVVSAAEENGVSLGNTVELWGPATVKCYNGSKGDQYYSCEYYYRGKADGPDAYVTWGNATQTDFEHLRFMTLIVSVNLDPEIKVNYIDIDTGEVMSTETYTDETGGKTEPSASADNTLKSFHYGSDTVLSTGAFSVLDADSVSENLTMLKNTLDGFDPTGTISSDPGTISVLAPFFLVNTMSISLDKDVSKTSLANAIDAYTEMRNEAIETLVSDSYMGYMMSRKNISAKTIPDYCFEYACGSDSLSTLGAGLVLMGPDTEKASVLVSSLSPSCVVNMYYRCDKVVDYTIKIRVDGTIDESLTKTKQTLVGDVIEESEVDTSSVPSDYTINSIENVPLKVSKDPDKNIIVIDCSSGEGKYTVKVRINGTLIDDLSSVHQTPVGTVIREADVDTSIIPDSLQINTIENTPLTVSADPTQNIIIIDCGSKMGKYKVLYYKDGVLAETAENDAVLGTVVPSAPLKSFPGYNYDRETGTPLTVTDQSGVIRVYYVKNTGAAAASTANAKLYKDEYQNVVTKHKSGYGVWGLFFVDISQYVNAKETVTWSVPNGCSAKGQSKTVSKYTDFGMNVTATYSEGLDSSGNQIKNGKTVTVNMVKDATRSSATVWAYRFPNHSGSNKNYAKAYIPINWKDGTNWKVNFKAEVSCKEYNWKTTSVSTSCSGHKHQISFSYICLGCKTNESTGLPYCPGHLGSYSWTTYCTYTYNKLTEWNDPYSFTVTGSAAIMISGNMYEDDFTGDRR